VLAKGLALSSTLDYRLKSLVERFGERPIAEIKTADLDDVVADLKQQRVVNGLDGRGLTPASTSRPVGCLRHMLNWRSPRVPLSAPFRPLAIGTARPLAVLNGSGSTGEASTALTVRVQQRVTRTLEDLQAGRAGTMRASVPR
jgi:hypothetical protein